MQFTIHSRNATLSDRVRGYIEEKVGRLDRYLPSLKEARVEVREQTSRNPDQRYVVQLTLYDQRGTILRGEERAAEIFPAVDTVTDKMHRQISRFKGKRRDRYHRPDESVEDWGEDTPYVEETRAALAEEQPEVIRTKRFALSPMNTEEAIEQMELLGHTFFVFYDGDSGGVNVVYKRDDGQYGLIVPELA